MFESLSDRLGSVVSKLRNRGRLSEVDVSQGFGTAVPWCISSRFCGGAGG
jgi:hypothetical protein